VRQPNKQFANRGLKAKMNNITLVVSVLLFSLLVFPLTVQTGATTVKKKQRPNRLINEKSPYLLQHAYNPVDWYPWGDEAFEKARREGKAIFLSIGYSTCHWCHVMAHESFEDPAIGALLNKYFVCIKVDREERPDIDQVYMAATQAMTGSGGWPMSVFLFPDGTPFYAGTYFPPKAKYNRPGFAEIIEAIQKAWQTERESLRRSADSITDHLKKMSADDFSENLDPAWMDEGLVMAEKIYDHRYGGFGTVNKFPRPVVFDFLLRYFNRTGNQSALDMTEKTLAAMADGGIHDQLGGGFHRYSVDPIWRVAHFEKMLYDQAQLIPSYLDLYLVTGKERYAEVADKTIRYVIRDLGDENGGFYSAEDADSANPYRNGEKTEGAFYLWRLEEIESLLGRERADLVAYIYGLEDKGNTLDDPQDEFGDTNVFFRRAGVKKAAAKFNIPEDKIKEILEESEKRLFEQRQQRSRPHLDDKIITGWNGLMISALAKGATVLDSTEYLQRANDCAEFLLTNLLVKDRLKRRYRDGDVRFSGTLEDYAFLIQGLLDLYEASHDPKRLRQAIRLMKIQIELFEDERGGFFDAVQSDDLIVRMKGEYDGAEPAGNSVSALNLLRLARITGEQQWLDLGRSTIQAFGSHLKKHPSAMVLMLSALDFYLDKPRQIVVAGNPENEDTRTLLQTVQSKYLPNTIVLLADGGNNQQLLSSFHQFISSVEKVDGRATAYVCEDFVCQLPTNDIVQLEENLSKRR